MQCDQGRLSRWPTDDRHVIMKSSCNTRKQSVWDCSYAYLSGGYNVISYGTASIVTYMRVYVYVYKYISCIYTCMYICIYTALVFTYIQTYIHTYIRTCMHACIHAYLHTYIVSKPLGLAPNHALQKRVFPRKTWFFFDFIMLVPDIIILLVPSLDDGTTGAGQSWKHWSTMHQNDLNDDDDDYYYYY